MPPRGNTETPPPAKTRAGVRKSKASRPLGDAFEPESWLTALPTECLVEVLRFLEVHELLLLRPVATWANPQRLPAFATCPNCFATCAIPEPGTPVGRHRCRPTRALKSAEEEGQRRRLARLPGWGKGKSGKGPLRRANSSAGASIGNSLGERTSLALGPFSPALLPTAGGGGGSPAYAASSPSTSARAPAASGRRARSARTTRWATAARTGSPAARSGGRRRRCRPTARRA